MKLSGNISVNKSDLIKILIWSRLPFQSAPIFIYIEFFNGYNDFPLNESVFYPYIERRYTIAPLTKHCRNIFGKL